VSDAPSLETLRTATQIAQVLHCSARQVYRLGQRGVIPTYVVGTRAVRFRLSECLTAIRREGSGTHGRSV
jgi:excisionase family DNA binding protein